jgi:hypothetical protein
LDTPLNVASLPKMTPFAIGALQRPFDDYLDKTVFEESYQAAYRLLFSRHMVDVLSPSMDGSTIMTGQQQYTSEAIILVPAFTYVVSAFLAVTTSLAAGLLCISHLRPLKLHSDAATISSIMSLVVDDPRILPEFNSSDKASNQELEEYMNDVRFELVSSSNSSAISRLSLAPGTENIRRIGRNRTFDSLLKEEGNQFLGVQPLEFKLRTGLLFFSVQILLFALIPTLFWAISKNTGAIVLHS